MKKSRKARTDTFLALLEYRNTPSQGMESNPVVRLMSRRTRTQVPTLPRFLKPVVDHNVHDKLLTNKERQAGNYNKGAKDLAELKSGDTVRLIPPRSLTNEAVKAKVNKPVVIRSYEVITEDGARYQRNRRHLKKTAKYYDRSTLARNLNLRASPSKQAEEAVAVPAVSEKAVSPLKQAERAAVVPAVSEQTKACRDPFTLQRQSESSNQPMAVSELPRTTRSGRVVKRLRYLKDFQT